MKTRKHTYSVVAAITRANGNAELRDLTATTVVSDGYESTAYDPPLVLGAGDRVAITRREHLQADDQPAATTVKLIGSGPDWAVLETWDGQHHRLIVGDTLTVPRVVIT